MAAKAVPSGVKPKADKVELARIARALLVALGEDPSREALRETPRRFADSWAEFIDYQPGHMETTFSAVDASQMVVVSGMRVWSMCEHHLLPFWCDVAIGYIARQKVLGLSKFARIAKYHAHRLQVQERLVEQIADHVGRLTESPDVAVVARGEHLCMTMRGIETPAAMTSSALRGVFRNLPDARAEFFSLAHRT